MTTLPKSQLSVQLIEATRLPVSSYRQRGPTYGRFQPFEVFGDSDALGNNQMNWTNLYLLNTLGNRMVTIDHLQGIDKILEIEAINEATLAEVKRIGKTLPREFDLVKDQIEELDHSSDLSKIKEDVKIIKENETLEAKVLRIEHKVERMSATLELIANKLGIGAKSTGDKTDP